MNGAMPDRRLAVFLAGTAVAVGAILLAATRWGIGVSYDSVFYLSAADNLLHGLGLSRLGGGGEVIPLTHFPPLYPLLLAAGSWLSPLSTSAVARWLATFAYAGLAILSGLIVKKVTNSSVAGASAAGVVASSPVFLEVDAWAMSEAIYLVSMLTGLWLLASYSSTGGWRLLIWAAVFTGAAYATRYVGASLLATGLIVVWLSGNRPRTARLVRMCAYGMGSALPALAWMTRNILLTGMTTNRTLVFHPLGRAKLSEAAHTLAGLALPDGISVWLRLAVALIALAGLLFYWLRAWWRSARTAPIAWDGASRLAGIFSLHAVIYAGLLVVSLSFLDASTRLDDRILSPLWLLVILLAGLAAGRWLSAGGQPNWTRWTLAAFGVGLVLTASLRTYSQASSGFDHGLGFNSRAWVTSPTVAWVQSLDPSASITSNEAFPLYYLTGRPVYWAPEAIDPVKGEPRSDLKDELDAMQARLAAGNAYLVIFHPDKLRFEMPPIETLTAGLQPILKTADAVVYSGK